MAPSMKLLSLTMCGLGTALSFLPLCVGIVDGEDNRTLYQDLIRSVFYREAALSSFLITIPSAIDVLIDAFILLVNLIKTRFDAGKSKYVKHVSHSSLMLRLSIGERFTFILGISCVATFILCQPSDAYNAAYLALYFSLSNVSTILTVCSLLIFLERCTDVWTPTKTFLVVLFTNLGSIASSWSYCYAINGRAYFVLNTLAASLICAAATTFVILCTISIAQSLRSHFHSKERRYKWLGLVSELFSEPGGGSKFYKHFVPGIYTFALFSIAVSNVVWYFMEINLVVLTSALICLQTAVAVVVFVVEIRIRHNEVVSGLDLLDSKRSFVRYISHEIRTPLSTVMMGLDLLVTDLDDDFEAFVISPSYRAPATVKQISNRSLSDKGNRHCETILLIQESCKLAVEICDDLLNYEKFENDNMPLVIKTVPAAVLFNEIVQPFNVQARRNGVTLHCDILDPLETFDLDTVRLNTSMEDIAIRSNLMQFFTQPSSPNNSAKNSQQWDGGSALQRSLIDVDKRRIAHVLRNLVSNALNFTPSGGDVTVTLRLSSRMGPKVNTRPPPVLERGLSGGRLTVEATSLLPSAPSLPRGEEDPLAQSRTGSDSVPFGSLRLSELLPAVSTSLRGTDLTDPTSSVPSDKKDAICPVTDNSSSANSPPLSTVHALAHRKKASTATPTHASGRNTAASSRRPLTGTNTPNDRSLQDLGIRSNCLSSYPSWLQLNRCVKSEGEKAHGRVKKKGLNYLIVEVTDTGTGIAKENLDRIFKEIVRFNPNELHGGSHGGSGLGMVLSKGIVEAHGGKLWLTSAGLGKGSTFGFGLPLSKCGLAPELDATDEFDYVRSTPHDRPKREEPFRRRSLSAGGGSMRSIKRDSKSFHSSVVAALTDLDGSPRIPGASSSPGGFGSSIAERRMPFKAQISRMSSRDMTTTVSNDMDDRSVPGDAVILASLSIRPSKSNDRCEDQKEDKNSVSSVSADSQSPSAIISMDFIPETSPPQWPHTENNTPARNIVPFSRFVSYDKSSGKEPPGGIGKVEECKSTGGTEVTESSSHTMRPRHALIVEDSSVCRRMLGKVLQSLSITYEEAEDGVQAVEKVQLSLSLSQKKLNTATSATEINLSDSTRNSAGRKCFDLILCDNIMPNMCGPKAVKLIRLLGFDGPIFGVTGNMLSQDVEDFIHHGADVILGKPLQISVLSAAVKEHFSATKQCKI